MAKMSKEEWDKLTPTERMQRSADVQMNEDGTYGYTGKVAQDYVTPSTKPATNTFLQDTIEKAKKKFK